MKRGDLVLYVNPRWRPESFTGINSVGIIVEEVHGITRPPSSMKYFNVLISSGTKLIPNDYLEMVT